MNHNQIMIVDTETCSKNKYKTQPLQLSAVVIDPRRLEIISESVFNSYIKPYSDDEAVSLGLDPIQQEALDVNHIKREDLEKAPLLKNVWPKFIDYVNKYNYKKDRWTAPILAGYNVDFDLTIMNRIATQEPYRFGPMDDDKKEVKLFHPIYKVDVMHMVFNWHENDAELNRIGADKVREYYGCTKTAAHNAVIDVVFTAQLLIKFYKLQRKLSGRILFRDSFGEENKIIEEYARKYV